MEIEEDTYSSIFQALKHPIRRRILRMLKEQPLTYTEILNELGIDNGLLNYHLENLRELLAKGADEKYRLSEFGNAGISVIDKIEVPKNSHVKSNYLGLDTLPSIIAILLLFSSALMNGYYYIETLHLNNEIRKLEDSYTEIQQKYTDLDERYEEAEKKLEYYSLWMDEIELVDPRYLHSRDHADLSKYRAIAMKMNSALRTDTIEGLKEVFVYHYPDWNNGTAYIALSDLSPEFTGPILEMFSEDIREYIRFIKAPASLDVMERWRDKLLILCESELKDKGVNGTSISTYYNGKIMLGVEKVTPDTLDIITGVIHGTVPPGVIVVEETGKIVLNAENYAIEDASPLGDMTNYTLVFDTEFPDVPSEMSIVYIEPIPLESKTALEICESSFGMTNVSIENIPWNGIALTDSQARVEFFGLNRVYYSESNTSHNVSSWSVSEMKKLSDDFLARLATFWDFNTGVELRFRSVDTCSVTIEVDPDTGRENLTFNAVGVYYDLYYDGVLLTGPGADFNVWVDGESVVDAELHYPCIHEMGSIELTMTPQDAVENFIHGRSDIRKLGFEPLYGPISREGICTINSVRLVYYVDFKKETQDTLPLLYEIKGRLTYTAPDEGTIKTLDFTDYQFATN